MLWIPQVITGLAGCGYVFYPQDWILGVIFISLITTIGFYGYFLFRAWKQLVKGK